MKKSSLVASTLFVLAGFCAGVGLNLLPLDTVVQGAPPPPDPQPALKSVAHDRTLAGDGTQSSLLGIANGGVSAPKLSASLPPSAGQVLGFNGSGLAWQNAPVGGVRVVDSFSQDVGPLVFNGKFNALLKIGTQPILLQVDVNGFVGKGGPPSGGNSLDLYYPSPDCSGPAYVQPVGERLFINPDGSNGAAVFGMHLYYPAEGVESIFIHSQKVISGDPPQNFRLCAPFPGTAPLAVHLLTILDLNVLGLVPPFHLDF